MNFQFRKPKGEPRSPTKVCLKCRVEKDVYSDFYWSGKGDKSHPAGRCKACAALDLIAYRETRKAKYCEYAKNARLRNPEKARERDRIQNAKHGAERRKRYLEKLKTRVFPPTRVCQKCGQEKNSTTEFYRHEQPCKKCRFERSQKARATPEGKEQRRREYLANMEEAKRRASEWRKANPERRNELARAWLKTPKGRQSNREKNWDRRARLLKAKVEGASRLTAAWFETVKAKQGNTCIYCGFVKPLTMDHLIPLARGGKHVKENIVAACKICNCQKSDLLLHEWKPAFVLPNFGLELATG
jgi:5-methylcytosine-specific restriction endonuclease McrA